jgi:excisionase family DNA binding protein
MKNASAYDRSNACRANCSLPVWWQNPHVIKAMIFRACTGRVLQTKDNHRAICIPWIITHFPQAWLVYEPQWLIYEPLWTEYGPHLYTRIVNVGFSDGTHLAQRPLQEVRRSSSVGKDEGYAMSTSLHSSLSSRPQLLKVPELAALLKVKPRTIYEMVAQGRIPYRKPPGSNILRFDLEEIIAWTKAGISK